MVAVRRSDRYALTFYLQQSPLGSFAKNNSLGTPLWRPESSSKRSKTRFDKNYVLRSKAPYRRSGQALTTPRQ
ncbi:hypothetical protein EFP6CSP_13505 [Enterococcus faecium]|nr:hypothetical protein EFP6CSP_13505 [Enterococcus faecium]